MIFKIPASSFSKYLIKLTNQILSWRQFFMNVKIALRDISDVTMSI